MKRRLSNHGLIPSRLPLEHLERISRNSSLCGCVCVGVCPNTGVYVQSPVLETAGQQRERQRERARLGCPAEQEQLWVARWAACNTTPFRSDR